MRIQEVGECGVVGGLLGRAELTGAKSSDPGPHPDVTFDTGPCSVWGSPLGTPNHAPLGGAKEGLGAGTYFWAGCSEMMNPMP